ncbi:MAG: hypothetical protein WA864_00565 [Acetobacteraceae bacterium]
MSEAYTQHLISKVAFSLQDIAEAPSEALKDLQCKAAWHTRTLSRWLGDDGELPEGPVGDAVRRFRQ